MDGSLNIKSENGRRAGAFTARQIYAPGWLMNITGRELRIHGFKKESLQLLDRAIRWLNSRPDEEKATKITGYTWPGSIMVEKSGRNHGPSLKAY